MMNFQMQQKETDFLFVVISFFLRLKVIDENIIIAPLQKDARGYYLYAVNLKKHGVYSRDNFHVQKPAPDAFCSPGYPLSIIPFVEFPPTGKMIWNIQRMQVILGCISVALVFFLAQYCLGRWLALFAMSFSAISPHLVVSTLYILTEAVPT